MNNNYVLMAAFSVFLMLSSGCAGGASAQETPASGAGNAQEGVSGGSQGSAASPVYTMGEVSAHNSASDCWAAVDGKVYDLSPFTSVHPGGDTILNGCGKDASAIFGGRHSQAAREKLEGFYIGKLG